jgi:signal transduction histidine kinase
VRIEVADSGPGVDAEVRAHVFDRFAQGTASTTRRFGGSGLGLAIAKEFTELHGGTIVVEESAEGGAAFVVELPRSAPEGTAIGARNASASSPQPSIGSLAVALPPPIDDGTGALTRATVLVVEDNREMNDHVTRTLTATYLVERAYDGEEGLAKARTLRPDLILTDLMMPRKNGEELVRELRLDRQLDRIPVVLLTARSDDELRTRLLAEGAQDYVTKPFTADELLSRIGNLIALARLRAARLRDAEASKLKTDFLGLVSHELRTPLTAMQLLMDRLVDADSQPLPARETQIVERLATATARLTHLVDTLLHYARIQSGHLALDIEPCDLGALAAEAIEEVRPQAQRKSLELSIQRADSRVRVETDPKLVRMVIVNLVSNAVKFTEQGSVTIVVENRGDRRLFRIIDTGPGIAEAERKRIFEPFQQLEPTKHKHLPGVGLGLSLVRQIVDNLKAEISVHSEVGKGSTFEVSLPATHPEGATDRTR